MNVFVPTLKRSSLRYCLKALRKAGCHDPRVVKNMRWTDACNFMADSADRDWFLRVDDDMLLCKWSVNFFNMLISKYPEVAVISCNLFDWRTKTPIRGVKAYHSATAKRLRFLPDKNGRIDRLYASRVSDAGMHMMMLDHVVGVHAQTEDEEQRRSWLARGEKDMSKFRSLSGGSFNYREQMEYLEKIEEPDV